MKQICTGLIAIFLAATGSLAFGQEKLSDVDAAKCTSSSDKVVCDVNVPCHELTVTLISGDTGRPLSIVGELLVNVEGRRSFFKSDYKTGDIAQVCTNTNPWTVYFRSPRGIAVKFDGNVSSDIDLSFTLDDD